MAEKVFVAPTFPTFVVIFIFVGISLLLIHGVAALVGKAEKTETKDNG